jgi:hypothetical protein
MSLKQTKSSLIKSGYSEMKLPEPFRPRELLSSGNRAIDRPEPQPTPNSLHGEERGLKTNPVQNEQGPRQTRSKMDGVQSGQGENLTGSKMDPVLKAKAPEQSARARLPLIRHKGQLKARDHYTAVPNCLLREVSRFQDPTDFMIYLKMFSFSFGFGRNVCDMGLNELIKYTGLGRNTIRRSIERLAKDQWIKLIEDFEPGRVSRQWRVFSPWEKGLTPEPTYFQKSEESTGSELDPVQISPGPSETLKGSNLNPTTGSNLDTHIESIQRKIQRNFLSCANEKLAAYFSELKPARKRESEWNAFKTLRKDYGEGDITACLNWLRERGIGEGQVCHSPMAYLSVAMNEVLGQVRERAAHDARNEEAAFQKKKAAEQEAALAAIEAREGEIQLHAFRRFCAGRDEAEVIGEINREQGFPISTGQIGRSFAISHWWRGLSDRERAVAAAEARTEAIA